MSNELEPASDPGEHMVYQIRIEGHLGGQWTEWFGGLAVTLDEDGHTVLTGPVVDQAALHGLLRKVRDLGMPLVSVNRVEPRSSSALPSASVPSASLGTGGKGGTDGTGRTGRSDAPDGEM